jgi:HK97 family phage major capsid protein
MLARYSAELEERQQFMDGIVDAAEKAGRDLDEKEMELVTRARERIGEVHALIKPLKEAGELAAQSAETRAQIATLVTGAPRPQPVEYRSAGAFVLDFWQAGLGIETAVARIETFKRAAAHQTTADNPGLIPEPILGPVLNFIDAARPLVSALGPRQLPSGQWSRPKVTQHTQVGQQSGEKTELVSRKMVIGNIPVIAKTFGGYVNVSRQNVDWSQPQVMDIVIGDLAAQYALETEAEAGADFSAAATAATVNLPTGATTSDEVAAAFWSAVGQVYAGTKGQGRVIAAASPQMLGLLGPLFAPINPVDAQSAGMSAVNFGQGAAGTISGVPVYITAGLPDNEILVLSTAAAEVYEDRIGALQVVEPSVLGIQVAYGGYFSEIAVEPLGIIKITKTP